MRLGSRHQSRPVRVVALIAALAMLALAAVTFGGDLMPRVQAQGTMSDPTLSSDTAGNIVVSWTIPSPEPSDYRIDWAKSGENYNSWRVNEGHVYPAGTATTVTITGLEAGTQYKVRMRARYNTGQWVNDTWSGPFTGDVLVTVASEQTTAVPRDLFGNGPLDPGIVEFIDTDEPLIAEEQNAQTILFSNLEQEPLMSGRGIGHAGATQDDIAVALPFETGPNPSGYLLQGVTVSALATFGNLSTATLKAAILTDSSGTPGTEVHALGELASPTAGALTLEGAGPFNMTPDTTYWLTVELDGHENNSLVALVRTASQRGDPNSQLGWSAGRYFTRTTSTGSWSMDSDTNRVKFALLGERNRPMLGTVRDLSVKPGPNGAYGYQIRWRWPADRAGKHITAYEIFLRGCEKLTHIYRVKVVGGAGQNFFEYANGRVGGGSTFGVRAVNSDGPGPCVSKKATPWVSWTALLTAADFMVGSSTVNGYAQSNGGTSALVSNTFSVDGRGTTYTVTKLYRDGTNVVLATSPALPEDIADHLALTTQNSTGHDSFTATLCFSDATKSGGDYTWTGTTVSSWSSRVSVLTTTRLNGLTAPNGRCS